MTLLQNLFLETKKCYLYTTNPKPKHEYFKTMTQSIGANIRKIRELKGYSQQYISLKLAISQNAYSKMENGRIKIDEKKLKSISQILEVEETMILNFNENLIFLNMKNVLQTNTSPPPLQNRRVIRATDRTA